MTRFFDADGNEIPQRQPSGELEWLGELGGEFDKMKVTLSVYSKTLDRHEVSRLLGVEATKAWNPGERHPWGPRHLGRSRAVDWGKWYLDGDKYSTADEVSVDAQISRLLARCSDDLDAWRSLAEKYDIWLTVVGHLANWNRELLLEPETLAALSARRLALKIDVYFDSNDDEQSA